MLYVVVSYRVLPEWLGVNNNIGEVTVNTVDLVRSSTWGTFCRFATNTNQIPRDLYICFLDVKKAFDSVSHESLLATCRRIGLPEPLIGYIRGTYERGSTRLLNGGKVSSLILQGVKQGDPLSCFLFNTVIDWVFVNMDPKIGYK